MKANEAPEKIYLFENPINETPDYRWLSKKSCDEDIEYIRTDAFIEKASEWLNNFYSEDRHCFIVKEDIDAFIKAMEE